MVTFISQCEKNALKKTRRVLDSFASRIGDNTWQTIITQEGLEAVQKLLRKTASKSTAVSCHWIRSRSRSDFLWVVGNKDEFNEDGIISVNYGTTKRFIGEKEIMVENIYANTNTQRLDQHLFAVGYLSKILVEKLVPENVNLANVAYVAGCWHDIGKIDIGFQEWVNKKLNKKHKKLSDEGEHIDVKTGKFSWQKYPRHNEFSLLLFEILFQSDINLDRIKHAIYWHHSKPLRNTKDEIKNIVGIYNKLDDFENKYRDILDLLKGILSSIDEIAQEYDDINLSVNTIKIPHFNLLEESLEGIALPMYKRYSEKESIVGYKGNIQFNALNNLARTAVITADRLISKLTADELNQHLSNKTLATLIDDFLQKDRGLNIHIRDCLNGFEKKYPNSIRNEKQKKAALELSDEEVTVGILKGAAGCGKTKIALEWALNTNAKKIYWICPRVQVCEGIFQDLISSEYLENTHIEIITGEIKQSLVSGKVEDTQEGKEFSADIIITTIDQIVNSITTHKHITTLVDFMNAHIVFDEYHEYITMQGFNLLFAELIECKKYQQNDDTLPNTLLVSATPNPLFVKDFLRLNENDMIGIDSFNTREYKIDFVEYDEKDELTNPLMQKQKEINTFVISNTATTAQRSFIEHQSQENSILFHSKFTKKDKAFLFNEIFDAFKKEGTQKYDVLRSGPVVQASLNISCKKMISEMTHAENFLQRLGRLDRFGTNDEINNYTIAITTGVKNGKSKDGSSRFLNQLDSLQSAKIWYEFLENNLVDKTYSINDFYKLYDKFYDSDQCKEYLNQDLVSALKKSVLMIDAKVLDPKSFPQNKVDSSNIKIKKNSLRGDSLFIQMAKCKVENLDKFKILEEYAYADITDAMTVENRMIEGYGDSKKNLLSFMAKKHHNIKDVKKSYNDAQLKNEARDPLTPIYLSYTLDDLKKVESEPHEYARYYAIGKNQPIGVI
jgi:CRISPR-associated endonuclease/helicase Cas3